MSTHPNVAAYSSMDTVACPKCGGTNLEKRGTAYTNTNCYQRFVCKGCGGWAKGKATKMAKGKRDSLLGGG